MPATVFADQIFPGAKIITASLSVSNTSGSYTTTVSDDRMTGAMKAIALEIADPSVFNGKITVNATAGQYTFSCPDVAGSTTVVISFLKTADDPTQLTSSEFDVLNNRIGDLTTLTTTAKESAVAAINEVVGSMPGIKIVEATVLAPTAIGANTHIHETKTLSKTYALAKHHFILTPVSYVNTAFITATGHWGDVAQNAQNLTESNKITIYVTNLYSAQQTAGCYLFVVEHP